MGEEHKSSLDDLQQVFPVGVETKSTDYQTATAVGEKIYLIGGSEGGTLANSVQIYDKSIGKWLVPTVLGTKPAPCKGHSAVLLNNDRILVFSRDSAPDDCTWFLEVDTAYVREQKRILETEVVAWSKGVRGDCLKPIVISGPSGVGKGTLISKLMKEFPSTFGFSVSHTTRAPREKEIDGFHYHFTERSLMEQDIQDGRFLETACVHGNLYGTSIAAVQAVTDLGKRCILDIDVQGAKSVRASPLEAIFIFITPPSFKELEDRLRARGTETEEQVQKRLRNARAELEQGRSAGLFDHILVNDDLDACYANLKKILGLDASTDEAFQPSIKNVEMLAGGDSQLEMDQKVSIDCGSDESEKPSNSLFMLDVSSLKGGAPGQTKGLKMYAINQFGENGIKQLQNPTSLSGS